MWKTVPLEQFCPNCGKRNVITLTDDEYTRYYAKNMNIQIAMPKRNRFERELIISGMCYECQEKTFHTPLPEHAIAWGKIVMECECCGSSLYDKHDRVDGVLTCPSCGWNENWVDGESDRTSEESDNDDKVHQELHKIFNSTATAAHVAVVGVGRRPSETISEFLARAADSIPETFVIGECKSDEEYQKMMDLISCGLNSYEDRMKEAGHTEHILGKSGKRVTARPGTVLYFKQTGWKSGPLTEEDNKEV